MIMAIPSLPVSQHLHIKPKIANSQIVYGILAAIFAVK